MGLISRLKEWVDNEVLNYSDLNNEFNNILGLVNGNIDANNVDTTSVATLTATQTLTNKTLTSPVVNTPTIVIPTIRGWSGWIEANESWSYSGWDDVNGVSTATITVPSDATTKYQPGMRIKFDQPTDGTKYGIITSVSATSLTVFMNTDYDFDNEAISNIFYSPVKTPLGFDMSISKWMVQTVNSSNNSQASPVQNTWYNLGGVSIDVPIGMWCLRKKVVADTDDTSATVVNLKTTLATTNSSETDSDLTVYSQMNGASGTLSLTTTHTAEKCFTLSSKTTFYLNTLAYNVTLNSIANRGDLVPTLITASCAYL